MASSDISKTPTAEQLRSAVDSGATGEKVPFTDPAAAPLGTDAEAGGKPPTRQELNLAAASMPKGPPTRRWPDEAQGIAMYAAAAALICAALLGAVILA